MSRKSEARKKRIISGILVGCLAIGGTATYLRTSQVKKEAEIIQRNRSIYSTQVKKSTIKSTVVGTGSLDIADTKDILVPSGLTVDQVLVESGDQVEEGQVLATLDSKSVDKAILAVETSLDSIDKELSDMDTSSDERILTAPVSGRVKVIYAYGADKVKDVTSEHGSLMTLSTDGKLAVDIPDNGSFSLGSQPLVQLPDGDRIYGTVDSIHGQELTITIPDQQGRVNGNVTVLDGNGNRLAEGKLYVHSPINITAPSGTVNKVYVSENAWVEKGDYLFRLTAANNDLTRQQLLGDREDLVQTMNKLKEYSRSGSITAPCAGTIKDINLSDNSTISKPLSSSSGASALSSLAGSGAASFDLSSMMGLSFTPGTDEAVISLPSHSALPRAISLSFEEEWAEADQAVLEEGLWAEDDYAQQAMEEELEETQENWNDAEVAWSDQTPEAAQGYEDPFTASSKTYLQGSIYLPIQVPREGEYPVSSPMVSPLLQAHLAQEGMEGAYVITGLTWLNPGPFALGERCIALVTLETNKDNGIVFTPSTEAFTIEAEGGPDNIFLLEDGDADGYYERMVVGLAYNALPQDTSVALDQFYSDDSSSQDNPFLQEEVAGQAQEAQDFYSEDPSPAWEDALFEEGQILSEPALEESLSELPSDSPFGQDPNQVGDHLFESFQDQNVAAPDLSMFTELFGGATDPAQILQILINADDATLQAIIDKLASMSEEELNALLSPVLQSHPEMAKYTSILSGMLKNGTLTPQMLRNALQGLLSMLPSPTPTPEVTATPSPEVSGQATPIPTGEATPAPTGEATPSPTGEATPSPTGEATPAPTGEATTTPTPAPSTSGSPSITPSVSPAPSGAPSQQSYLQLLMALLGGGDVDYSALLQALLGGTDSEQGSFISAILSSLFQGSGDSQGLLSLLSSLFSFGSENPDFTSDDSSSSGFSLSSFLQSLLGSGNTSALSGLSSLLSGGTSGLSSLLGGSGASGLSSLLGGSSASGLSSLLGGSSASGLSSLLGSSGASDLSSLLGSSGASGLSGSSLSSLLGGNTTSAYTSLLDSLGTGSSLSSLGSRSTTASTYQDIAGFTIADSQILNLVINVNELDVLSIAVGQLVEVTLDSLPNETFPGIVTKIAQKGNNTGGLSKFPVTVSLLKDEHMLTGMNASATITVKESPNVLVVPSDAIHETYGKTYVYTSKTEEGILEGETQVTTGISDGDYVEITQGLSEGQTIYYNFNLGSGDIPYEQMMNQMQEEMNAMQDSGNQ